MNQQQQTFMPNQYDDLFQRNLTVKSIIMIVQKLTVLNHNNVTK